MWDFPWTVQKRIFKKRSQTVWKKQMNNRVWNIIIGLNICLCSGDSLARLSHCRVEGTMTSCIAQTLDAILPNVCCVVAELTRSSEGVSQCKKKHTRKHTQIPFYLRPRDRTSVCISSITTHTLSYKLYSTCNCRHAFFITVQILIKKKQQVCATLKDTNKTHGFRGNWMFWVF